MNSLIILAALTGVAIAGSWDDGAPCSSAYTMSPSQEEYGNALFGIDPPYHLSITDRTGRRVGSYIPGERLRVRLTGGVHFRAFMIQPRLATKRGFIIGHLKGGSFQEDDTWLRDGVKMQNCDDKLNQSVTNWNFNRKYKIEVDWIPDANVGPIQFLVTVMQEPRSYWRLWQPNTGFLWPDKSLPKVDSKIVKQAPPPQDGQQAFVITSPTLPEPAVVEPEPAAESSAHPESEHEHALEPVSEPAALDPSDFTIAENIKIVTGEPTYLTNAPPAQLITASATEIADFATTTIAADNHPTSTAQFTTPQPTQPPTTKLLLQEEVAALIDAISNENTPPPPPPAASPSPSSRSSSNDKELLPEKMISEQRTVVRQVLDPRTNRIISFESPVNDYCQSNPCLNGGQCENLAEEDSYRCICPLKFTGQECELSNFCHEHECENDGICLNSERGYTCECQGEWAGQYCNRNCPAYLCENGGTCNVNETSSNLFFCDCAPGWTGDKCELDFDECAAEPCLNGAKCTDELNGFKCECAAGFMGETCHRPCQDVYNSCDRWRRENRCTLMRQVTNFFDSNCAVTCNQCEFEESTVKTLMPIPPVLEPFAPFIGRWYGNYTKNDRFPVDFPRDSNGYDEYLEFSVAEVPMFGTPSINVTSYATSVADPDNVYRVSGFLTLNSRRPDDRPEQVALLSTSNDGLTLVEEGTLVDKSVMHLTPKYAVKQPLSQSRISSLSTAKRTFTLSKTWLQETVSYEQKDGKIASFTKYFYRVKEYETGLIN